MEPNPRNVSKTVVLVDDEDLVRRLVARVLEREGYRVIALMTAEEALAILSRDEAIDLLLTDVTLPGMNGVELARLTLGQQPDLKLICMSGSGEEDIVTDLLARATGTTAFLSKPFSTVELVETVNRVLDTVEGPSLVAGA
jgi:Response regulator containing CheY-like receiver, AAA-type ATPase, and DNA-binding domains